MSYDPVITGDQCAKARGLLGWTITRLASRTDASEFTIRRLEAGGAVPQAKKREIRATLERAGIEITSGDVRLRDDIRET